MNEDKIIDVCRLIRQAKDIYVLTGAGISTESGIPDFRSPGTGLWQNIDPMKALSANVLYNNPQKFYKEGFNILMGMEKAKPNKGHYALAKLESLGYIKGIITQNIDNLHKRAGSKTVYEVHGHTRTFSCMQCNHSEEIEKVANRIEKEEIPPKCMKCGGTLRTDVVLFGDQLPEDFAIAWELVRRCDLLIVVGSSLTVAPVSYLPQMVDKLVIINIGDTPYDRYADIIINEKSGETLEKILQCLERGE